MARKKRTGRMRPRRNRRRFGRKARNKATQTIIRAPSGFPDRIFTKLKYSEIFQVDVIPTVLEIVFRGNGPYDPEVSFGGHSPMYYNDYANLYRRYTCFGSKIQLDVLNKSSTSGAAIILSPSTDDFASGVFSTVLEQPRSKIMRIIPIASRVSHRMKMYASTLQQLGIPKSAMYDDLVTSPVNNVPTNQWFWNLLIQNSNDTGSLSLSIILQMTYYVCFFDRSEGIPSEFIGEDGPTEELVHAPAVDPTP